MTRPEPDRRLSGAELRRWYWLRSELVELARMLRISASGGKAALTERVAAALDGDQPPDSTPRAPTTDALGSDFTADTVIPAGQRCTQSLRAFFVSEVGPGFRFDAAMRAFIGAGGATLAEAVDHWHQTRGAQPEEIAPQFELNRFTRAWYAAHPGGSRPELLAAWAAYRAAPVDQRWPPG